MGRRHLRLFPILLALGVTLALALRVEGPLDAREPAPARGLAGRDRLLAELRVPPGDRGPAAVVENPSGPPLELVHEPGYALTVQPGRCPDRGDALVTLERTQGGLLEAVVRRAGAECFRVPFPEGEGGAMPVVRTMGTMLPGGGAGPLAIVESLPSERSVRGRSLERRLEVHLAVIDWSGRILLERALRTVVFHDGGGGGEDVRLTPLVWDGGALVTWSQARVWSRRADQCVGSLLAIPHEGPVRVSEGLPCTPLSARDVDGDGRVEIHAESSPDDSTYAQWSGEVSLGGDLVPVLADRDVAFRFDLDGDGADDDVTEAFGEAVVRDAAGELLLRAPGHPLAGRVDGPVRELVVQQLPCGIAAVRMDGSTRCAPPGTAGLGQVDLAGTSFDWTGDGTPDVTLASAVAPGHVLLVAWTEGDRTFSRDLAGPESLAPLHQAPRALSLSGDVGPEVLVVAPRGFAVQSVPGGEVRWESPAGVLDAWAVPTSGATAIAPR